jgi:hypothetical protein
MADATSVLMAFMRAQKISPDFKHGQLAVGLEIVSLIRTLESFPVVNDAEKEGTIACLHTLLREQGLENAYEAYEVLAEWRRVKFVRASSPQANGGVVSQHGSGLRVSADAVSSAREARGLVSARTGRPHERLWERPNQEPDASPRDAQLALPYEAEQETPSS